MLLMLLFSVCCMAQPRLRQRLYCVGVHGGVSAGTMLFLPEVPHMKPLTETALLSGTGGVAFRYVGHKYCALQIELNYQQCGWREVNTDKTIDYKRQLNYLMIPFLSHVYFGSEKAKGFINLGPQIGYCFSDVTAGEQNPQMVHQYGSLDSRFYWGIAGGVGFYYRTPKAGVYQIEARVTYGLGSVFGTRTTDFFSQANAIDLGLHLGYFWEFKEKGLSR